MWDEIVKHLVDFSSAVLTGVDKAGYPFSVRCKPEPDLVEQVLQVQVPEYTNIQPGSAGLLCHKHDEHLWNLKSFILRGSLERGGDGWVFRPQRFTPGAGIGGLLGNVRFLLSGRRIARRYLDKRGLERPGIPWDRVHALWTEIKKSK
jgi:hypothetical protein